MPTAPMLTVPMPPNAASQRVLAVLRDWAEQGVLRRLDVALARLLLELCPQMAPELVVAVAILADLEGRGHTCVALDEWPQHLEALKERAAQTGSASTLASDLSWPDDAGPMLRACPVVHLEGGHDTGAPLVVSAGRPPADSRGISAKAPK